MADATPARRQLLAELETLRARVAGMAAEWVPVATLQAWAGNPRLHRVPEIAASIRRFGFGAPLLARARDGDRELIAGHGRRGAFALLLEEGPRAGDHPEVARLIGERALPVRWMDLTAGESRALLLADNQLGGEWDRKPLSAALRELRDADVPLEGLGWDAAALSELLATDEPPTDDPGPAQPPRRPTSQPGTIYELGPHRLLCGDSTRDEPLIRQMFGDGPLARLVASDPPFGVSYESKGASVKQVIQNDSLSPEATEALTHAAFAMAARFTLPGAALYAASPSGELLPRFIAAFTGTGFVFKHCLVWVKDAFVLARCDYHYRHESILYGWKDDGAHYFVDDRTQDSVLEFARPRRSPQHPTTKPTELYERFVLNSSRHGDAIYEPFSGSGTTLLAAARHARVCRAVEIDPSYADVTRDRWTRYALAGGLDPGSGALELPRDE